MRKELEEKLYEEFPRIFKGRKNPKSMMIFGIACGDGWFDLIHTLCTNIMGANPSRDFEVYQVKEKFGGLCFCCNCAFSLVVRKLIEKAESDSLSICELCGSKDDTVAIRTERSWQRTLCAECEEKK